MAIELYNNIPQTGHVKWIGLRPERLKPVKVVDEVAVDDQSGLVGDRFSGKPRSTRMVTLIQAEHLPVIASILGRDEIDPAELRRNIVVSGINLLSLKAPDDKFEFHIGTAVLQMTGNCHPCSRMEEQLGPGGFNAMRGHGGITATVIQSGKISVGDEVRLKV